MTDIAYEYECALTGVVADGGDPSDDDGLGDLPVGWTRVQLSRRQFNPKWVLIQQVKQGMIHGMLEQTPDAPEFQRYALSLQVEAQFHSLEGDTPMYLPDLEEVVYISGAEEITESLNQVRSALGLDPLPEGDEEEEIVEEGTGAPPADEETDDGGGQEEPAQVEEAQAV